MSLRTSLNLTNERERPLEKASDIVASGPDDDPQMGVVIDAALAHLIESKKKTFEADAASTTPRRFSSSVTRQLSGFGIARK